MAKKANRFKKLRFNSQKASTSLLKKAEKIADTAVEQFYLEASMDDLNYTSIKLERDDVGLYIRYKVIFGASAIMKSFGTGSLMDKTSRYLDAYMSSPLFNRLRQGFDVVGREAGTYTNIYGKEVTSAGAYAGTSIEGYIYHPTAPNNHIKDAEKWLEQKGGWLDQMIERELQDWLNKEWNGFWEYK